MGRHFVLLAALLVEAEPVAFALRVVVFHRHGDHGTDSGKRKKHRGQERPVAQADQVWNLAAVLGLVLHRDALEKRPGLLGGQDRRFSPGDDMLRPPDRVGRVDGHDLAGHQPVEEHADGGEVLLDRGLGVALLEKLDVGGHGHGLYLP